MPSAQNVAADVARAFLVTPPPNSEACAECSHSTCHAILGKSLLKIKEGQDDMDHRVRELEMRPLQAHEQAWRKRSSSPLSAPPSFYEALDERIQQLPIVEINDNIAAMETKLDGLQEEFDETFGTIDEKLDNLMAEIDDAEVRLTGKIDDLEVRLTGKTDDLEVRLTGKIDDLEVRLTNKIDDLEVRLTNKIDDLEVGLKTQFTQLKTQFTQLQRQRYNGLVTRPTDVVQPATFLQEMDGQWKEFTTPRKKLSWWWRLHQPEKRSRVVQLVRDMDIAWKEWLQEDDDLDSSDDEDSDDLDPTIPETLEDAVIRNQQALVRAILTELGLDYNHFDDLNRRHDLRSYERGIASTKRSHHLPYHERRIPEEPLGGSYMGSPTEVNTEVIRRPVQGATTASGSS
ncbi:hypothetical protein BP6252_13264 [Coleophoma cylindrospora]|uniref:Uncharacterized protein n=1 Tax=Coleophoma cylindrospora TaxID=1849047 RepID=A0A3D8QB01_9HELO|nr:hypothetical protein BP6252_13264 [Coleophoma cylindrospora]